MADVKQIKKIVPFVTCEIPFGQDVCELVFGINVSNLNFRIKIHPVKQPVQSNSVGPGNMSHCGTSAFYYHCSHGFIVHKNVEHRTKQRRLRVRQNMINITQLKMLCLVGSSVWFWVCLFDVVSRYKFPRA